MSEQHTIGLCNNCKARTPAQYDIRDGQVWICKSCPKCGTTESMVSTDAAGWQAKREIWEVPNETPCTINCDRCHNDHQPAIMFMDVTNRCNMDCPICGFSLHGMGFEFNPPLAYFEKVFAAVAKMHPRPTVNLFGGEPTVREDMFQIIELGRKHGVDTQVTTNGLRLADEEYCRKLCEAGVGLRISFDGRHREIYEKLRNDGRVFDKKMKAMQNLKKYSRRKHTVIACAAIGINDGYIADLIQFCYENRELVSDLGIIPLYESWDPGVFEVAQHTTAADVEKMVAKAVPGGGVEFIPAGLTYWLKLMRPFFRDTPTPGFLFFAGVHPNCEAATFLIPTDEGYRGINHYMTKPLPEAAKEFNQLIKKIEPKLKRLDPRKRLQRLHGKLLCLATIVPFLLRTINFRRVFGPNPIAGTIKSIRRLRERKRLKRLTGRPSPVTYLRVAVLPFEEQHSIDSDRLKHCKAGMPYEDVATGRIEVIPHCIWYPYRNAILKKIADKYGTAAKPRLVSLDEKKAA